MSTPSLAERGAWMRCERVRRGLSVESVSDRMGLADHTTLCGWETGRHEPPLGRWFDWCDALDLDAESALRAMRDQVSTVRPRRCERPGCTRNLPDSSPSNRMFCGQSCRHWMSRTRQRAGVA
ncbi:MAG: helix-turn-helix domain-containing protein [Candidatus Nanopelagicales bacterium]